MNAMGPSSLNKRPHSALRRRRLEGMAILCVVAAWWAVPAVLAQESGVGDPPHGALQKLSSIEVAIEVARGQHP